jgi:hypothetical protein
LTIIPRITRSSGWYFRDLTQINDHLKLTERYLPAASALSDAQSLVEGICETVKGLPRG